jgi:hypothetical protein
VMGMMGDDEGQQVNIGEWLVMVGDNKGCPKNRKWWLKVKDNEGTMGQWHGTMGDGGFMTNQQQKHFSRNGWVIRDEVGGGGDARCEMLDDRSNRKGVGMDTIDKPIKTLQ